MQFLPLIFIIEQLNILFAGGIQYCQLLNYSPYCEKIEQNQVEFIKDQPQMEIEENQLSNPYFQFINNKAKIIGKLKYDISFLNYINYESINAYVIMCLEDIYLLPFLCQNPNFKAKIYTTLPVMQIGQSLVYELLHLTKQRNRYFSQSQSSEKDNFFQESQFLDYFYVNYDIDLTEWTEIFEEQDILQSFARIQVVSINEVIQCDYVIDDDKISYSLTFKSSGYGMGSFYTIINVMEKQIGCFTYLAQQNFMRYCLQLQLNELSELDCAIFMQCLVEDKVDQQDQKNKPILQLQIEELVDIIQKQLKENKNSNFIIPVKNLALLLDLYAILIKQLGIKISIISETFQSFMAFTNSGIEFLSKRLQNKILSKPPSIPFDDLYSLVENRMIRLVSSILEILKPNSQISLSQQISYERPQIYFIVDPVFRFVQGLKLVQLMDEVQKDNVIIFTDPYLQNQEICSSFIDKIKSKIVYCPINFQMSQNEFSKHFLQHLDKNCIIILKESEFAKKFSIEYNTHLFQDETEIEIYLKLKEIQVQAESKNSFEMEKSQLLGLDFQLYDNNPYLKVRNGYLQLKQDNLKFNVISTNREKQTNQIQYIIFPKRKNDITLFYSQKLEEVKKRINEQFAEYQIISEEIVKLAGYAIGFKLSLIQQKTNQSIYIFHTYKRTKIYGNSEQENSQIKNILQQQCHIYNIFSE